jgi:hypothetical protein
VAASKNGRIITNDKSGSVRKVDSVVYCFITRLEVMAKTLNFSVKLYRLWPDALPIILNQSVRKSDAGKRNLELPTHPSVQQRQKRMAFVTAAMHVEVKWMGNPQPLLSLIFHGIRITTNFLFLKWHVIF